MPGTGFIRDWYSPDNSSDYNSALKHTDEAAANQAISEGVGSMRGSVVGEVIKKLKNEDNK